MSIDTQKPQYTRAELNSKTVPVLRDMVRKYLPLGAERSWIIRAHKDDLIRTLLGKSDDGAIPLRLVEGLNIVAEEFSKMMVKNLMHQIQNKAP